MHRKTGIQKGTIDAVINKKTGFVSVPFRSYAEQFQMIQEDSVSVVINNCEKTEELLGRLRFGERSVLRKYLLKNDN